MLNGLNNRIIRRLWTARRCLTPNRPVCSTQSWTPIRQSAVDVESTRPMNMSIVVAKCLRRRAWRACSVDARLPWQVKAGAVNRAPIEEISKKNTKKPYCDNVGIRRHHPHCGNEKQFTCGLCGTMGISKFQVSSKSGLSGFGDMEGICPFSSQHRPLAYTSTCSRAYCTRCDCYAGT